MYWTGSDSCFYLDKLNFESLKNVRYLHNYIMYVHLYNRQSVAAQSEGASHLNKIPTITVQEDDFQKII